MTEVVGIDLGTTYSVVAHLDVDGNPEVIPDEDGNLLVPSVISFASDPPVVGALAKSEQADGETEVIVPSTVRDHSANLFKYIGIPFQRQQPNQISVNRQREPIEPFSFTAPADVSSAAFFMVGAAVTEGWKPWGDPVKILEIWDKATYVGEVVPSIYKPWHFPWSDRINIEVSKALTGQITADACCDNVIAAIKEVQKG